MAQTTGDRPGIFSVKTDTIWVNLEHLTLRNEVIFQGANFSTEVAVTSVKGSFARPGLISSLLICNKKISNSSNIRGRDRKVLNCGNSAQNRSNGQWQWQGANRMRLYFDQGATGKMRTAAATEKDTELGKSRPAVAESKMGAIGAVLNKPRFITISSMRKSCEDFCINKKAVLEI
ncbi:hypothetical protein FRX31_007157 [Thalictrum thalictroides]|uniref:Uncharacterized protein n=1 Tax=Thalictrum thalictroides TaxID=46969 RepID=A0A7J6X2E5_THATH|nr:hypothetical protein FRX31_007157 [Thalictrum thalictroides]